MSEKKEMEKCNEIVHIVAPPVEAVQNKLNGFDHLKDMFLKESPFTERSLIAYADVENIDNDVANDVSHSCAQTNFRGGGHSRVIIIYLK